MLSSMLVTEPFARGGFAARTWVDWEKGRIEERTGVRDAERHDAQIGVLRVRKTCIAVDSAMVGGEERPSPSGMLSKALLKLIGSAKRKNRGPCIHILNFPSLAFHSQSSSTPHLWAPTFLPLPPSTLLLHTYNATSIHGSTYGEGAMGQHVAVCRFTL